MEEGGKKERKEMQMTRKRIKGAILLLRQKKGVDLVSFVLNVKCNNSAVITVCGGETGKRGNDAMTNFHPSYIIFDVFFPQVRKQTTITRDVYFLHQIIIIVMM